MYLIGILIGLGCHGLTYLFSKEMANGKRVLVVLIVAILTLFASIFLIGGFEGMPFGVLSLGIFTASVMLFFFGRTTNWRKLVYVFIVLFAVSTFTYKQINQVEYLIIKKTHYEYDDDFNGYFKQLQKDPTIKGYKTFTISEGNQAIVLSLGGEMAGNNIEVLNVEERGNSTIINIRTFYNQSPDKNPVIVIGLNRVEPHIVIMDSDGTVYEQAK